MARPLPPATAEPFTVDADAPRAAALCLHGYTGSTFEVLPVALALREAGVSSRAIVLPGHEGGRAGDPHALNRTSWQDWTRAAADAFEALPTDRPRLLVASSMGALVALHLAARRDDVAGLVLLAPALRFFREGRLAAAAASRGLWRAVPYVEKKSGSDVADDESRKVNPCLPFLPLKGIAEMAELQRVVEGELSSVRAPACLFHGAQDHTIPPEASEVVAQRVSSARVERHILRDSFHVLGIDIDRDQVCALAQSFTHELVRA